MENLIDDDLKKSESDESDCDLMMEGNLTMNLTNNLLNDYLMNNLLKN